MCNGDGRGARRVPWSGYTSLWGSCVPRRFPTRVTQDTVKSEIVPDLLLPPEPARRLDGTGGPGGNQGIEVSIPPLRGRATGERVILGLSIFVMLLSVLLVLLVLLHKGKGGGLSDMFGGGVTSSLGGSSVVERNLDRMTIIVAVVWIIAGVVLGLLINRGM
ncbi:hypothetical protein SUDANB121_05094 [Nocardiopsis dassonvillei]